MLFIILYYLLTKSELAQCIWAALSAVHQTAAVSLSDSPYKLPAQPRTHSQRWARTRRRGSQNDGRRRPWWRRTCVRHAQRPWKTGNGHDTPPALLLRPDRKYWGVRWVKRSIQLLFLICYKHRIECNNTRCYWGYFFSTSQMSCPVKLQPSNKQVQWSSWTLSALLLQRTSPARFIIVTCRVNTSRVAVCKLQSSLITQVSSLLPL